MAYGYFRNGLIGAALLLSTTGPAVAEPSSPAIAATDAAQPSDNPEQVQGGRDRSARMTVPVTIGATGPFHFVVDTGAERTVISRELATRLALGSGGQATLVSISGASTVDMAIVPRLNLTHSRASGLSDLRAPIMEEANLGAPGMLGSDSLRTKRVVMDFKKMRMTISEAKSAPALESDEIVVTARTRLGRLVLVDAMADGQKINVVIDTGAAVTIGNPALRARLERRGRLGLITPISITSVTGGQTIADYTSIKKARIGNVTIGTMPIAFADAEIFHELGLSDKPAMLLGMDVLVGFDRVSIDFANKTVRFLLPGDAWQAPPPMLAAAGASRAS